MMSVSGWVNVYIRAVPHVGILNIAQVATLGELPDLYEHFS